MLKSMKKCPMFPQQHGSNWFFLPSYSPSTGENYMLPNDQLVLLESVASLSLTKASTRSPSRMMFTDCPKSPEDSIWGQLLRGFFSLSRVCKSHSPLCALYLSCEEPLSPKHGFTCSIIPSSFSSMWPFGKPNTDFPLERCIVSFCIFWLLFVPSLFNVQPV